MEPVTPSRLLPGLEPLTLSPTGAALTGAHRTSSTGSTLPSQHPVPGAGRQQALLQRECPHADGVGCHPLSVLICLSCFPCSASLKMVNKREGIFFLLFQRVCFCSLSLVIAFCSLSSHPCSNDGKTKPHQKTFFPSSLHGEQWAVALSPYEVA